jgi:hypothetical protein
MLISAIRSPYMGKRNLLHLSGKMVFFAAAFGIALALIELPVNLLGGSLIDNAYSPGRILELAATLLTYVLTVLAWEILAELKSR